MTLSIHEDNFDFKRSTKLTMGTEPLLSSMIYFYQHSKGSEFSRLAFFSLRKSNVHQSCSVILKLSHHHHHQSKQTYLLLLLKVLSACDVTSRVSRRGCRQWSITFCCKILIQIKCGWYGISSYPHKKPFVMIIFIKQQGLLTFLRWSP